MNGLLKPLEGLIEYKQLERIVNKGGNTVLATGVIDSQKIHLTCCIQKSLNKPAVYITYSELHAKQLYEDLKFYLGKDVSIYPSKDVIFYTADVKSKDIIIERFKVLNKLRENPNTTVVVSVEALIDKMMPSTDFYNNIIEFNVGDDIDIGNLSNNLVLMGYERREAVESIGQFAIRGGIIDIITPIEECSYRIELWGDTIDSIRALDAYSQRSVEKLENATIFPMRELIYTDSQLDIAIKKIENDYQNVSKSLTSKGLNEEKENLSKTISQVLDTLREEKTFSGIERFLHYFHDETVSMLDYISNNAIVFIDEPLRVKSHMDTVLEEFTDSIKSRILKGNMLPNQTNMVFNYNEIIRYISNYSTVLLTSLDHTIKDFNIKETVNFTVRPTNSFKDDLGLLTDDIKHWQKNNYTIAILTSNKYKAQILIDELVKENISSKYIDNPEEVELTKGVVNICKGKMNVGFEYVSLKYVVVTDNIISDSSNKKTKRRKHKKGSKIESFAELKVGDYIVHDNHGVGVYKGMEQILIDNIARDYMKIEYADGGNLFVQTSQMDVIQKYIGGESTKVKLNKLSGAEWSKSKTKAKKAIAIMAKDLVELYAKRQASVGFSYSTDTVWQREFEDTFPFTETDDQLDAIEDVKKDMESNKVMDRLICGDVGYGKTEIAIRAAFKAVQDGKQVAYLVPTTILAQQIYTTFSQRMQDFPIQIELLSRFRTKAQQTNTINKLAVGTVDIVIGTHRLLSKDVVFKDAGLLIVDEEQRFGVTHKEKLKALKKNIDVLTLTATPIPRTLHMSMTGIREMSVLEEPPMERQPIQTYVTEYNEDFIKDAIIRELGRNGQVYYLHNRVRNIAEVAGKIQQLVPYAKVAYAHGQMSERELENIMIDFIKGEINVLVCTTIIETGLDISNVNTMIIQDADRMGLSQLYQLRGRVGRSNRLAYAYLMYKKEKVLSEISEKRLSTIKEFTEFGAGFKIAMRDLEIRGAGNLLGAEQHGHMDSIGYELYCRLLDQAIKKIKNSETTIDEEFETSIDIKINAYLPKSFIHDQEQKLEIYKKISYIKSEQDFYDIQEEIEDRFGNLPKAVQGLLDIALLKAEAHNIGVVSIVQKSRDILIKFKQDAPIDPNIIMNMVKENSKRLSFTITPSPVLTFKMAVGESVVPVNDIKGYLIELSMPSKNHEKTK